MAEELEVMTADRKKDAWRRWAGLLASLNEPLRRKPRIPLLLKAKLGVEGASAFPAITHRHFKCFCASVICRSAEFKGASIP